MTKRERRYHTRNKTIRFWNKISHSVSEYQLTILKMRQFIDKGQPVCQDLIAQKEEIEQRINMKIIVENEPA